MPRARSSTAETALYVRLPSEAVEKLDRAAHVLGIAKKEVVAGLVSRYVDPDSSRGRKALGELAEPGRPTEDPGAVVAGTHSFRPHDEPQVLTPEQAAELLQVDVKVVLELAEAGELPGRKLGDAWRFARTALLAWLSATAEP